MRYFRLLTGIALMGLAASSASADVINLEASDNATVQPAGPRTGTSGKNFLNIEGSANNAFASYGVADFTFAASPVSFTTITSIQLQLTQSNAGFSLTGPLSFYLSTATGTNIQPTTSPLIFDAASPPGGVGSQLDTLYLLGSGTYTVGTTGDVDSFNLSLPNSTAESYLLGIINGGGTARFVMAADATTTAATYAGFSNTTLAGPTVIINASAVPEPSTMVVLTLSGLAGIGMRYRNRKRQEADAAVA